MTKLLSDIIYKTGIIDVVGSTNIAIDNITFDSRKVNKYSVFVAVNGSTVNGHHFINDVVHKGALAVVCESFPDKLHEKVTYIKVTNSSVALGIMASNFYGQPSEKLKLVGITGTNGKTTVATLLFELFKNMGYKVGLISTVVNKINQKVYPSTHTTPNPIELNALLAEMVNAGVGYCFMEVSSHAIHQNRIAGVVFAGGVFTNITHDHLDYHKTFDNYIAAKKLFFDRLPSNAFALVNKDDANGSVMVQNCKAAIYTYSQKTMADFKVKILENHFGGLLLNMDGFEVVTNLIGAFNAYNLMAVYASAVLLKQQKMEILTEISNLQPVEGRFKYLISPNKVYGIVDYAHTPDALKNVLETINDIRTKNENLITVIGCGGDRDKTKRPIMANIACKASDKVIFTSDNPRSENPNTIIDEMKVGVEPIDFKKTIAIVDRREAIKTAWAMANQNDIILIAGKGHEKYQEINGVKHDFDDLAELKKLFELK